MAVRWVTAVVVTVALMMAAGLADTASWTGRPPVGVVRSPDPKGS